MVFDGQMCIRAHAVVVSMYVRETNTKQIQFLITEFFKIYRCLGINIVHVSCVYTWLRCNLTMECRKLIAEKYCFV